ncbi:hypothetical protein FB451DRAFT_1550948 [Mycena latifolia]|nr:hypothetical protein FB451DRAFT_1550948 [Mycena latifolia]
MHFPSSVAALCLFLSVLTAGQPKRALGASYPTTPLTIAVEPTALGLGSGRSSPRAPSKTQPSPSTSLQLIAHLDSPIVLLEAIDYLFDSVQCRSNDRGGAELVLRFASADAHAEALASWSIPPSFSLVTCHPTCNLPDQRAAWLITAIQDVDNDPHLLLTAHAVPLSEAGASFRISHFADAVTGAWGRSHAVVPRAPDFDRVYAFGNDLALAPRQRLFPIDSSLLSRASTASDSDLGGLQVFCVDCASHAHFSVGIEIDVEGIKITAAHVNLTVQQFEHDIQLEFAFNDSLAFHRSMDVIRAPLPDLAFTVPDFGVSGGFFYGGTFSADLDISGALNFSIGARATVPAGATASFVMKGDANSSAIGWDGASLGLIPFRLNSGTFDASAQLTLSPFLELEFNILDEISASARIAINTPQISAASSMHTNVNRECEPIGPTDFESFRAALTFGAGARLDIHTSTNGSLFPDASDALFGANLTFEAVPPPSAPACFIVVADDGAAGAGAGPVPAPTGTLAPAAAAVPTFDVAGIEAYYKASGALPTGVNYTQLVLATAVPDDIKSAMQKMADGKSTSASGGSNGARPGDGRGTGRNAVLVALGLGVAIFIATWF